MRVIGDVIIVKKDPLPEVYRGGKIIIPELWKDSKESGRATVIAVGTGYYTKEGVLVPPIVKPGDRVLIQRYGGQELILGDEKCHTFYEREIVAIIEDEDVKSFDQGQYGPADNFREHSIQLKGNKK